MTKATIKLQNIEEGAIYSEKIKGFLEKSASQLNFERCLGYYCVTFLNTLLGLVAPLWVHGAISLL